MNDEIYELLHVTKDNAFVDLGEHDNIAIAGDWHGDTMTATQNIYRASNLGVRVIFQLGDFGLMPGIRTKKYLNDINDVAKNAGIVIYWLDGNHEDFNRIEKKRSNIKEAITYYRKNIAHMARGTRWSISGIDFCAVGGAVSLDKNYRTENLSWWRQEELTYNQINDIAQYGKTDILLSHDLTYEIEVPGIKHREYTVTWDKKELERAWLHRERLGELTTMLSPTHIYHGHFHISYTKKANTSFGLVNVRGLADNFNPYDNITFVNISELKKEVESTKYIRENNL